MSATIVETAPASSRVSIAHAAAGSSMRAFSSGDSSSERIGPQDHQWSPDGHLGGERAKEGQRQLVRPLEVVEDEQQGLLGRERQQDVPERPQQSIARRLAVQGLRVGHLPLPRHVLQRRLVPGQELCPRAEDALRRGRADRSTVIGDRA